MKAVASVLLFLLAVAACSAEGDPNGLGTPPSAPQPVTRTGEPAPAPQTSSPPRDNQPPLPRVVGAVATGLVAPWGIAFLPDGDALVSERDTTKVLLVSGDGGRVRTVGRLASARPPGAAGLPGPAVP